ncbi:arginase [uncultured Lentibacter sp.]|uniref:arginase n=1 Tax=uncultured Lentibacter sp. TaxID=1659309 RepID=UPI002613E93C|nr:arginase [uncultured Lentibacter sp.]
MRDIILIGAPMDSGKRRQGCLMGPDAYRTAGLTEALTNLGYRLRDWGNLTPAEHPQDDPAGRIYKHHETVGWTNRLWRAADEAMAKGLPIFLGGDHALSLGSVAGVNAYATRQNQPQFLLWLDAHTDYHTPETTDSGNLHGTPVGYVTGRKGFGGFPKIERPIPQENVCILGLRSVDVAEREAMQETEIAAYDMRAIDETGIAAPLAQFLAKVAKAKGALHVSLDVDFLDPMIAPAVGTTVPGGATIREAHLVMEMICDSGLMTSLDLVELNPFLDERGRTAQTMVDLAASALGRRVFDRPTRAFN